MVKRGACVFRKGWYAVTVMAVQHWQGEATHHHTYCKSLGFTHAKIPSFCQGIPASGWKPEPSHSFSTKKPLGRCHEVGTACTAGRGGLSARLLESTHSLADGQHLLWRGPFFYSKNTAGIPSAWTDVFIKNHQSHSGVGFGWLSLLASHNCQQKRANESKQTISPAL